MAKLSELVKVKQPITMLMYCAPGVGKSTALGIIAEQSKGNTLVLDIDKTITKTLAKMEVVKDIERIDLWNISNTNTWEGWEKAIMQLKTMKDNGTLNFENVCVDNISELERCLLSDLGIKGKNDGVPSQGDYQKMQFKEVNSLRFLKSLGVNVYLTAWETTEQFQSPDGTSYSRLYPKVSAKIVDNICGLCDIVAKISIKQKEDKQVRGFIMEATQNIYAKNQIDNRKGCLIENFIKGDK